MDINDSQFTNTKSIQKYCRVYKITYNFKKKKIDYKKIKIECFQ